MKESMSPITVTSDSKYFGTSMTILYPATSVKTVLSRPFDANTPGQRSETSFAIMLVPALLAADRHRPYGLLKPLPVPLQPWDSISMDFIEELPSSNGYKSILVIIDHASKQAIFIACHTSIWKNSLMPRNKQFALRYPQGA